MRPVTPAIPVTGDTLTSPHAVKICGNPGNEACAKNQAGILGSESFEEAITQCRAKVERIAKARRAVNRRFRDIEFDLEDRVNDCLYCLFPGQAFSPVDVLHVPQIFASPQFFDSEGYARADDIVQGEVGDCWLLSAFATVSTVKGLIERLCVARDEEVGVYGFMFFLDSRWVPIVIDDLLCTSVPKFEELTHDEQSLFHFKKDLYNEIARKGGTSLYFARPGENENTTWLPLMEKAYAKLHGSYSALFMGQESEALEELTGGVATVIFSRDILDAERFWHEDLLRANKDRLFGCSFSMPLSDRNGNPDARVQGLVGAHAYSVLRAIEVHGKRFVVVRNPWGKSEWSGRWSDGAKEWTKEWLKALPLLGHTFGNDGQFIMEYDDWLACFAKIHRTLIFDSTWTMRSHWLCVTCPPLPAGPSYGDVSFKLTLLSPSPTVIALSQLNDRSYQDFHRKTEWILDFAIVRKGDTTPLVPGAQSQFHLRCVSAEIDLEAGTYIVYVRLDRDTFTSIAPGTVEECELGKLSKALTARAHSQSIASNFDPEKHTAFLPPSVDELVKKDFEYLKIADEPISDPQVVITAADEAPSCPTTGVPSADPKQDPAVTQPSASPDKPRSSSVGPNDKKIEKDKVAIPDEDPNTVYLGLRVYTKRDAPAIIEGRLHDRRSKVGNTSSIATKKMSEPTEGSGEAIAKDTVASS